MKEFKIEVPQGYEIDKENSTFECIKFKKKQEIKTWDDLCECSKSFDDVRVSGYCIDNLSSIYKTNDLPVVDYCKNVFLSEKEAKSALAMAQISQLMPYYGGAITDEEWGEEHKIKYTIFRFNNKIIKDSASGKYSLLAFKSREQRDDFYNHNEKLVKEYLMID